MDIKSLQPGSCVLVIDDHDISRQHTVQALRELDCCVKQAQNGRQALIQILNPVPDLVFLDLHLPDISGVALLRQIVLSWPPEEPLATFVVLSGDISNQVRKNLGEAGVTDFLSKPAKATEIRQLASRHLDLAPGVKEPSAQDGSDVGEQELLTIFHRELQMRLPELDRQISNLEWDAARDILHQLIASCAICRQPDLEVQCRLLYQSLGDVPRASEIAPALFGVLQQARLATVSLQT